MKSLTMQFLSLLICFEFILAPIQGSLVMSSAFAEDKTCPAGQQLDKSLNRCLTKAEVLKVNDAVKSCEGNKDCYRNNAVDALNASGASKKNAGTNRDYDSSKLFNSKGEYQNGKQNDATTTMQAAAVGIPLLIATNVLINKFRLKKKGEKGTSKGYKCSPNSLMLMFAAAAALGAGEVIGYYNHKKKLDDIQEVWNQTITPDATKDGTDKVRADATEAQSQAFEFLAQNEDQVAKTAKLKRGFYIAATGLFAAGTAAAVVEQFQLKKAQTNIPLAHTLTKSGNALEIARGRKMLIESRNTIERITCSTHENKELEAKEKEALANADAGEETLEKNKQADLEGKAAEAKSTEESKLNEAAVDERVKKFSSTDRGYTKDIAEKEVYLKDNGNKLSAETRRELESQLRDLKQEQKNLRDQNFDDKMQINKRGKDIDASQNPENTRDVFFNPWENSKIPEDIQHIINEGIKAKSIALLDSAEDTEQLMQLIEEMNAIEFENYSRVTYLDEKDAQVMKKISLSQIFNNAFIPKAEANGGLLAMLGTLPALFPLVSGILKKIKFKGGQPVDPVVLGKDKEFVQNKVSNMIGKPVTRIAINGVLAGWVGVMIQQTSSQASKSKERAKMLRTMKEDFVGGAAIANCTESDRNDSSRPKCYCYTPDNKINTARSSQAVCKMSIASLKSNDWKGDDKVCVTEDLAVDASCSCRNQKGSDGKNKCLKATAGFAKLGFNPGTFKMISAGAGPANDLFNGTASGADIADSAGINAARIRASAEKMLAKTDPKAAKDSKSLAGSFEKALMATAGGYSTGNDSGSSALPNSPKAAAAALDKELKENKADTESVSQSSFSPGGNFQSNDAIPEFGMGAQEAASQEIEIAEVMGKEVDFGSNDINKAPETNLFDVLSNRYKRSGMKRLFEDGKPADAPSKTDISN